MKKKTTKKIKKSTATLRGGGVNSTVKNNRGQRKMKRNGQKRAQRNNHSRRKN